MRMNDVWAKYHLDIKAFLHSLVSNPADVDDLVQDVSLKAYSNFSKLRDPERAKAWLFQIAHHAIIDHYRTHTKARDVSVLDLWYGGEPEQPDQGFEPCVKTLVNALPKDTKDLLRAIDGQGQSQKAYAQAQGIAYSTLKSRVKKGRELLRKSVEDCCHLAFDGYGNVIDFRAKSSHCEIC